jgi:hypothetical protein
MHFESPEAFAENRPGKHRFRRSPFGESENDNRSAAALKTQPFRDCLCPISSDEWIVAAGVPSVPLRDSLQYFK